MDKLVFSKLLEGKAYDTEYIANRKLTDRVKQIYNPVPSIIDMDMSLIRNSVKVRADEYTSRMDWNYIKSKIIKEQLYDRAFVDIEIIDNEPMVFVYSSDQVECEYDAQGNIIEAKIDRGDLLGQKQYYIDDKEKRWAKIKDEQPIPITYDEIIFPIFEITGKAEEGDTGTISRIEELPDKLDLINEYEGDMKIIFRKHADAPTTGQVNLQMTTESVNKDDELTHIPLEEGGEIKYLEMQGNVINILKEKTKELKDEIKEQYPELKIQEVIWGSGESGYAIALKLLALISIIELYRDNFSKGLKKLFNTIQIMMRKNEKIEVQSFDIIPQNQKDEIMEILNLYQSGLLPQEIALEKIAELKKWSERFN